MGAIPRSGPVTRQRDVLSFIAKGIFGLTVLAAAGVIGYKWYLGYSIGQMSAQLEAAREEIAQGQTGELIKLNDRIVSTETLIQSHRVVSPLFTFLESSTPKTVRFSDFTFGEDQEGPFVVLRGAALTYAALALEADVIYKNKNLKNPVFSDLRLDDKGNVTFSLKAGVTPEFISYAKTVGRTSLPGLPVGPAVVATSTLPVATSTATTTPRAATSTPRAATSTPRAATTTSQ